MDYDGLVAWFCSYGGNYGLEQTKPRTERGGEDGERREREALLEEGGEEPMVEDDTEVEEEDFGETSSEHRLRYLHSSLSECSDPEEWQELHHFQEEEESDDDKPPERGLPSGSTHLNPEEVAGSETRVELRISCMNDTIHSILTIMAQFMVMPWYQRNASRRKIEMMLATMERMRQLLILNKTDSYLARRILRTMSVGTNMHEQTDMVKDLFALLDRRVGAPTEPFVDLEDAMVWCLGNFPRFNNFLSDAQPMFSLMDHDSDDEPKGGGT